MSGRSIVLIAIIAGFGALTGAALIDGHYMGVLLSLFGSWAGTQIFLDLMIVAALACIWMIGDAPEHGLPAWPFVAVTLVAGSFGLLFYLLAREIRAAAQRPASA